MAKYTEAQKRAIKKYESEKIDSVHFKMPKGKRAVLKECAAANNESVNGMLNRLVDEEIKRVLKK